MTTLSRLLKALAVLLVLAHLVLAAAWLARPYLRTQGWLPSVPPERFEVARQALPAATRLAAGQPETAAAEAAEGAGTTTAPKAPDKPPAPSVPADPPPGPLPCALVGPFADSAAAQAARDAIENAGGTARLQAEPAADYLVFVPPAATMEEATETRAALRRHGLDAYVVPSGERRGGVSVGVFRDRNLALAQQRRAAQAGHPAQMVARERATRYRLLARAPAAALAGLPQAACDGLEARTPDRP